MPGRPNWQRAFRRDYARLVSRAVAANIILKNAKPRNSPRLESASNKRRREAAQRSGSGAGSGPGAAAMADLSEGAPGPSDAAAAANESAEVDEEPRVRVSDNVVKGLCCLCTVSSLDTSSPLRHRTASQPRRVTKRAPSGFRPAGCARPRTGRYLIRLSTRRRARTLGGGNKPRHPASRASSEVPRHAARRLASNVTGPAPPSTPQRIRRGFCPHRQRRSAHRPTLSPA